MNDADYNNKETVHPFGLSKKGKSADLDALAAYVKSLTIYDVSPNKKNGAFSTVAAEGALLFKTYQCDTCHKGETMTNSEKHKVFNVGTLLPSSGFRLNKKLTGLDVPTLHQLWNSAPYLHNGSASSIEEAIEAHQNILKPKAGEVSAIATFLKEVD
jgi:cytochrome c peroxidase